MSRIRTMLEIENMSDDEFNSLMPVEYLENPENYLRKYGTQMYHRFCNVIMCSTFCIMRLQDGSRLKYRDEVVEYKPLFFMNN